jgi:hypothetical protein
MGKIDRGYGVWTMPGAATDREHVTWVAEARCGIGDTGPAVERVERTRTPVAAFGGDSR